jgi:RHS repeat-associated protein
MRRQVEMRQQRVLRDGRMEGWADVAGDGFADEVAGDNSGLGGHGAGMRWVLMLFVILAAVMGGEARAVVVMGREVVSERVGKAEEKASEALRVESERAFLGAGEAVGVVDGGPLVCWFPGGLAVARSFCGMDEALEWDGENRLTGMWRGPWKEELAQVPFESLVGEAVAGSTVWRWGYDHRSRRVQRDEPGSGGERLRTVTVFSGGTSAAECTETAAAGSAWTVPPAATVQHVRGPDLGGGTKGLLYSLRRSLQPNEQSTWLPTFNRYNGRGDVVAQSDIDGTTTWAASYQADGRRTVEAGTNIERHRANTKEEDPTGLLNEGFRYRDMETGTFISRDPLGHVDGPNVYCYVRQNPWTHWDPEGLETVAQHTANAEWAAKNGKYLDMLACTFMGFGRAINPADAKSELRNASAQMPALVDNARKEINNSSIPAPLKIVAKAALATAGNAEPLQLLEGGVQVKNTVHTHGLGAAGVMLDGIKKAASEDPVYFVSQLTSGFLMGGGGKILSKPGSGVLAAKEAGSVFPKGYQGGPGAMWVNEGRGLWKLTAEGADKVMSHGRFGTFYRSSSDGLWWAADNKGHGGSAFKVFRERGKGLEWFRDADQFGTFIGGKHKGATGQFIPWKELKGH